MDIAEAFIETEGGTQVLFENGISHVDQIKGSGDNNQDDGSSNLVGSTLNLFKLSGQYLPTETEKYESSVYQTPELNPSFNESLGG